MLFLSLLVNADFCSGNRVIRFDLLINQIQFNRLIFTKNSKNKTISHNYTINMSVQHDVLIYLIMMKININSGQLIIQIQFIDKFLRY